MAAARPTAWLLLVSLVLAAVACSGAPTETAAPIETAETSPSPTPEPPSTASAPSGDTLKELFAKIDRYRFARTNPALKKQRLTGMDSTQLAFIDELAIKAVVERNHGPIGVGATFIVFHSLPDDTKEMMDAQLLALGVPELVSVSGVKVSIAGVQGRALGAWMVPAKDMLVSLQGTARSDILDVAKEIIAAAK